jgi:hypothetical protein
MATPLQLLQSGYRLMSGEQINAIIRRLNTLFGAKAIQTVAAAGATQGTATQISALSGLIVKVTVTASTEGVKLPVASTGMLITVMADPAVGVKVYPFTNGIIGSAATNAAVALVKNKVNLYIGVDTRRWRAQVGG